MAVPLIFCKALKVYNMQLTSNIPACCIFLQFVLLPAKLKKGSKHEGERTYE